MLRGFYTAVSGMITQQRRHDITTNNIANLQTPGYKQTHAINRSFPEVLISLVREQPGKPETHTLGRIHTGVLAEENVIANTQGDLRETNNPFDFAILSNIQVPGIQFDAGGKAISPDGTRIYQPQAYFTVLTNEGEERYTRNGKFTVNQIGELVTSEGHRVLGQDGQPISLVDPNGDYRTINVKITNKGQMFDAETNQVLLTMDGTPKSLLMTRVDNPHRLVIEGYGLYRLGEGAEARPVTIEDAVEVRQGYVEQSNVDPSQAMIDLMTAARAYEANQKVVQAYDRSLEKAVNEVGRV